MKQVVLSMYYITLFYLCTEGQLHKQVQLATFPNKYIALHNVLLNHCARAAIQFSGEACNLHETALFFNKSKTIWEVEEVQEREVKIH